MKNVYDNNEFFEAYASMDRSKEGLKKAGEWHMLQTLIPDLTNLKVLDLGCGYGWHSKYAINHGASSVVAIDLSSKMIEKAEEINNDPKIVYSVMGLDQFTYPANSFDFVISNLVLHYVENIKDIYQKVYNTLTNNGTFIFNIEHPIFTSGVNQDWVYDDNSKPLYWPIDNYFYSGERTTNFLNQKVTKQHHTLTQILNGLNEVGFIIEEIIEAKPQEDMLKYDYMKDEMKRPMMLMVKVKKVA